VLGAPALVAEKAGLNRLGRLLMGLRTQLEE